MKYSLHIVTAAVIVAAGIVLIQAAPIPATSMQARSLETSVADTSEAGDFLMKRGASEVLTKPSGLFEGILYDWKGPTLADGGKALKPGHTTADASKASDAYEDDALKSEQDYVWWTPPRAPDAPVPRDPRMQEPVSNQVKQQVPEANSQKQREIESIKSQLHASKDLAAYRSKIEQLGTGKELLESKESVYDQERRKWAERNIWMEKQRAARGRPKYTFEQRPSRLRFAKEEKVKVRQKQGASLPRAHALKSEQDYEWWVPPFAHHERYDPKLHGPVGTSLHFVRDREVADANLERVWKELHQLQELRRQGPQHIAEKQHEIESIKSRLHVSKDPAADRARIEQLEKEKEILGSKESVYDQQRRKEHERNIWVEEQWASSDHPYAFEQRAARLRFAHEKEMAKAKQGASVPSKLEPKRDSTSHIALPSQASG